MTWLAIAVGGAIGSMARHAVNQFVHAQWPLARFPAATTVVNLSGCFVIGLLAGLVAADRMALRFSWREFVFVGLLGGYTTFSTFGLETFLLGRTHALGLAVVNMFAQVAGGMLAVAIGYWIGTAGR